MEALYCTLSSWTPEKAEGVWKDWLWGTDCNALPSEHCCDMNRMHVVGILCAVRESIAPVPQYRQAILDIIPSLSIVHLYKKPICEFSLRELIDQLECLQLNWGQVLGALDSHDDDDDDGGGEYDCENVENNNDSGGGDTTTIIIHPILNLVKACMARLGHIAHHAYPTGGAVLDDPQHTSVLPDTGDGGAGGLSIISRKALRQAICTCFSLLRVQDIVTRSVCVPSTTISEADIYRVNRAMKSHHIESSMDFFNLLQQMVYLAPGMRLVYRTNFAGMYNDVSQVIYFHYPRFCRLPQIPLQDIPNSPHHMLPLISQLIPDIPISYDDDSFIPGLTTSTVEKVKKWVWLICCSEVFLLEVEKGQIWTSSTLGGLVAYFLKENGRRVGDDEEEAIIGEGDGDATTTTHNLAKGSDIYTSHGHLRLLS